MQNIDNAFRLGIEYHKKFGACSQCVLAAIKDTSGYVTDDLIKASHALAGGVARSGTGTCGSLTGSVLAICSIYGRSREDFQNKPTRSFELSKILVDKFISEYGSTSCYDIQQKLYGRKFDLWNEQDRNEFTRLNQKDLGTCHEVVGNAVKWTLEILNNAK